jgi:hypothetical protein
MHLHPELAQNVQACEINERFDLILAPDILIEQSCNHYSVVGKQTLVVEAQTSMGTDTYIWSIDTNLSVPSEQSVIDDYLGGEKPIQITTMKYEGKVILPQGFNVSPDTLLIESGVAGTTPISSQSTFKVEMNTNATAMMTVVDSGGNSYLMKLFPKSEDIREVNPVITTKSTAISLMAIQPGMITGEPDIDAIILELINTLPETQYLANQIDSELSAGTFKLNGHMSQEVLTRMGACFEALNNLKLDDVLSGTTSAHALFELPHFLLFDIPVDMNCSDDPTSSFYDTDGIDNDGVSLSADIKGNGQASAFAMYNRLGRWAVLGVEQSGGNFQRLDWIPPRHFQVPNLNNILIEFGKLGWTAAQEFVNKLFKFPDDGNTFMNKLKEIINSYIGLTHSYSSYIFPSAGNFTMDVIGAHLSDYAASPYYVQIDSGKSFVFTAITEVLVPLGSIVLDVTHAEANSAVKDSINNEACADAWVQLAEQLPNVIASISSSIAQDGMIVGTGRFVQDFLLDTLCSENGIRLIQCVLKDFTTASYARSLITQKILNLTATAPFGPILDAIDRGIDVFNATSSTLMFVSVLNDDAIRCVDRYTADLSHPPVIIRGPKIAAGEKHTVAIKADGSLWTWGRNNFGQLGDGTTTNKLVHTRIGTGNDWAVVTAGAYHTLAIKIGGALWAWGINDYGHLGVGDGTSTDKKIPTRVGTDTDWAVVAAGNAHTMAIKTDGSLWAWGYNGYGELGDGTYTDKNVPTKIGTGTDWTVVSAGHFHTLAFNTDGSLWTWGNNTYGQLGDGKNTNKNIPTPVYEP